jgi:hypothetical protein
MDGDDQRRFCLQCNKAVHNLSAMAPCEVEALLSAPGPAPCVRFLRRRDGSIVFDMARAAALAGAALLAACAAGSPDSGDSADTASTTEAVSLTHGGMTSRPGSLIPEVTRGVHVAGTRSGTATTIPEVTAPPTTKPPTTPAPVAPLMGEPVMIQGGIAPLEEAPMMGKIAMPPAAKHPEVRMEMGDVAVE